MKAFHPPQRARWQLLVTTVVTGQETPSESLSSSVCLDIDRFCLLEKAFGISCKKTHNINKVNYSSDLKTTGSSHHGAFVANVVAFHLMPEERERQGERRQALFGGGCLVVFQPSVVSTDLHIERHTTIVDEECHLCCA